MSGPSSGRPALGGMTSRAAGKRCAVSSRAVASAVSSSNTSVTALTPERDTERMRVTWGTPVIASSTGWVTSRSTSVGESPGALVRTCTCTLVRSGTASMGRVW